MDQFFFFNELSSLLNFHFRSAEDLEEIEFYRFYNCIEKSMPQEKNLVNFVTEYCCMDFFENQLTTIFTEEELKSKNLGELDFFLLNLNTRKINNLFFCKIKKGFDSENSQALFFSKLASVYRYSQKNTPFQERINKIYFVILHFLQKTNFRKLNKRIIRNFFFYFCLYLIILREFYGVYLERQNFVLYLKNNLSFSSNILWTNFLTLLLYDACLCYLLKRIQTLAVLLEQTASTLTFQLDIEKLDLKSLSLNKDNFGFLYKLFFSLSNKSSSIF